MQCFAGISWGVAPWLFAPVDDLPVNAVLVVAVMGLVSASQGTLSFVRHGMASFATPMMLGMAAALLRQPDMVRSTLAFFVLLHLLLAIRLAGDHYRLLADALKARMENEALAQSLGAQVLATERVSQEKTRFLAAASHDLRQPLHALTLMGSALEHRLSRSDPQEARHATELMRAVDALGSSLHAMLDISRLDAGVVAGERRPLALNELFVEVQRTFAPGAEARDLALRLRATPLWVDSDPQLLPRLLGNLIDNALKYARAGGVLVGARARGDQVWIDVVDTGIGIDPPHMERIFEEFYQVSNPARDRAQGLGIGLAVVKRLAALLQAQVLVSSRPGRGSRFRVVLPRARPAPAPTVVTPPAAAATRSLPLRVLVLDDEQGIRIAVVELLRSHQLHVQAVADEAAARAALRAARDAGLPFDVLLLDYRLADGANGLQAGMRLQAAFKPEPRLLLVTGETAPERLREVHAMGIAVLHKPVRAELLLQALAQ